MTDERKPEDEGPVEARDDEGAAAEHDEAATGETATGEAATGEAATGEAADRAKRWADEQTEHWHGARSSDATQGRADEE
jgi:hypothetical protein